MDFDNHFLPRLSADGRAIQFTVSIAGREVRAEVSNAALEQHFWLRADADATSVLKTFVDGRLRIFAVAQRAALKTGASEIRLDASNFVK